MLDNDAAGPVNEPRGHTCGIVQSPAQFRTVMRQYFRPGPLAGEHCVFVLDKQDPGQALAAIGSDAETSQWQQDGLLDGRFPQQADGDRTNLTVDEMLDVWNEIIEMARTRPVRIAGEVSWWLYQTSEERLLRYESELNRAMPSGLSALCVYDLTRFGPDAWLDMLRTHPNLLIGEDYLTRNRYYLPPNEFRANRTE